MPYVVPKIKQVVVHDGGDDKTLFSIELLVILDVIESASSTAIFIAKYAMECFLELSSYSVP